MTVSRTTASAGSESATRTPGRDTVQQPCLLVPVPFTDQASWARVIRHARCANGRLDPDQWFPVSAEAGKARHEAAVAIAICTSGAAAQPQPRRAFTAARIGRMPRSWPGDLAW
jgi:hypothetical protein